MSNGKGFNCLVICSVSSVDGCHTLPHLQVFLSMAIWMEKSLAYKPISDESYLEIQYTHVNGRVPKWLDHSSAEWNIDGSSRTPGSVVRCSLTVHPAANGHLEATLEKLKAARKELATLPHYADG